MSIVCCFHSITKLKKEKKMYYFFFNFSEKCFFYLHGLQVAISAISSKGHQFFGCPITSSNIQKTKPASIMVKITSSNWDPRNM